MRRLESLNHQPLIKLILYSLKTDKGNTTTYEWTYGEAPLSVVDSSLNVNFDDDEEDKKESSEVLDRYTLDCCEETFSTILNCSQIDFGDAPAPEIDFGQPDGGGEIDFGGEGDIDWGNIEAADGTAEEIDFNISLEESGIVVEAAGIDGGIATGTEALTILDNPSTRNEFIDQLLEVRCSQRSEFNSAVINVQ